jgi:hypothetical protein
VKITSTPHFKEQSHFCPVSNVTSGTL